MEKKKLSGLQAMGEFATGHSDQGEKYGKYATDTSLGLKIGKKATGVEND